MSDLSISSAQASRQAAAESDLRIIGITGGVGMGKTTVADYLQTTHQVPVLDADFYAREAVEPGSQVLTKIEERYGTSVLLPAGTLNRARLGEIVFSSISERQWLEQQIHPYVRRRIESQLPELAAQGYKTLVLVIPLLFEAGMTDLVTEIWVVRSANAQQIQRLQQRQLTVEQAHARINSQMPIAEKVERADVVLDNSATLEALFQQVDQAFQASNQDEAERQKSR